VPWEGFGSSARQTRAHGKARITALGDRHQMDFRNRSQGYGRLLGFVFHSISSIVLLFVVTSKLSRKLVVANHLIDSITDRFSCLPANPTWGVLATTILVWARAVFPLMITS
jgi:hypothetical protein